MLEGSDLMFKESGLNYSDRSSNNSFMNNYFLHVLGKPHKLLEL
jgi:hypothetical protein